MGVLIAMLAGGLALTVRWGGEPYRAGEPVPSERRHGAGRAPVRQVVGRYLRGVAIALVAGFWAGLLVTGPAVRLVMRLLAVTSGDDAQRRLTEADEVVGQIQLEGTVGLLVFGGILPGFLSAAVYVLGRRLLPDGRLGGVAFGALHLVLAATRIDPLRPDNPDFTFLGPGWLSVVTFAAAVVLHGMAVAAIARRYSAALPPSRTALRRPRAWLPLAPALLLLVPGAAALLPIVGGGVLAVGWSRADGLARAARSDAGIRAGRLAVLAVALVLLPGTVGGLRDVVAAGDEAAVSRHQSDVYVVPVRSDAG